ncbi:MAG TPA: glycogen/starch/alpha-glucan phosphorylase [Acidobacteriaceae bacterium]|nr:glycogen/starch/alpha-glucan phosphorylase [Acidobacteriaceae bacterium]
MPLATKAAGRDSLSAGIQHHLRYSVGSWSGIPSKHDILQALAYTVRARLIDGLIATEERRRRCRAKRLVYLSAEFLIGQSLRNNLFNLGLLEEAEEATRQLGFDLREIADTEADAPLGNGGLGRLAACFLESLATRGMPAYGFGINYQFGLFKQEIDDGFQKEKADQWLSDNSPWLIERSAETCTIPLYGRIEHELAKDGTYNPMWVDWQIILGVPYDLPVVGFGGHTVNYLRLYSARASDEFDMKIFNGGDYLRAVENKIKMETVSKVLYPSDTAPAGKELRLVQEYFMVACALRDAVRDFHRENPGGSMERLHDSVTFQMNDTHPSLVVAELMRILVDEHAMAWEAAWTVTQAACAYTNHTLLPEALENWPVDLLDRVLPRHLQLIYEINRRFLARVEEKFPGDWARSERMSIIGESGQQAVRMANLAIVGSHSVNGVAALHSQLIKTRLVPDFYALWPERFNNKTNGVTHRRWLACCNPSLAELITRSIGDGWITKFAAIRSLEVQASEEAFQQEFLRIKRENKIQLATLIYDTEQVRVDPNSLFDVQVKRIHEYKRQLLNAMYVMHSYLGLVDEGWKPVVPRTHIFAGKGAPGYTMAKLIIKLINNIALIVNKDPRTNGVMKVVFMRNYRVSLAEKIIPAADLSEQISTAGMEASGTGNMKFAMNGALTIGTLDGANVEILEEVGADNIHIFGIKAEEIEVRRNSYDPFDCYHASRGIRRVLDALRDDRFCPGEPGLFQPIIDSLLHGGDPYFHLADFDSYVAAQQRVSSGFQNVPAWACKAILNVARSGKFTSDRAVSEYAKDIWGIKSMTG